MPQLPWQAFLFGARFAMHSHLFGEVMDIEPDQKSGRKMLAVVLGRIPTSCLSPFFLRAKPRWSTGFFATA